jgi:hypothetical protein
MTLTISTSFSQITQNFLSPIGQISYVYVNKPLDMSKIYLYKGVQGSMNKFVFKSERL